MQTKEASAASKKKYRASAKGKATEAAYKASEKGKEGIRDGMRKYAQTENGKAVKLAAQLRYYATPAGNATSRARERAKKTGVTSEMFKALLELQNGCCAVCSQPFTHRIQADHCHDTKKPRGLLCINCNTVEGKIKKLGLTPHGFADRLQRYLDNPPAQMEGLV